MTPRRPSSGTRSCQILLRDPRRSCAGDTASTREHVPARSKLRCNRGCELCGSPRTVRSPSSADAVAVVMTRRHLQAPAALNHQPAQAGPRHAAEACLLAPAGAALAHLDKPLAEHSQHCPRGGCCRRRPADAAFYRQQHLHLAAWPRTSSLSSRSSSRPPLCTAAVLDGTGAAAPDVRPRCHGVPVLCGVVCELDTPSTPHQRLCSAQGGV